MLTVDQARVLLSSIPKDTVAGHRDRTLIALMIYSFARISAALALDVGDLYRELHRLNIRLNEKGGKRHHMPCHHTLDAYLVQYMTLAGLGPAPDAPLFQRLCCKPDVGVSQIRTTTVLSSCFCVGQTVL